jgi:dTDP-4-dehydrorhamnose reductase
VHVHALSRADLDITDENAVRRIVGEIRPGVILNTAAFTAVDRAESEPILCRNVNTDGARFVALAARVHGARLVHVSTDYVYDGESGVPYKPYDIPRPLNVYGESKLQGERAVFDVLGQDATIVRTAWIYSAWGGNFVRKMLHVMAQRGTVNVVSDQVGSPTSARSVAGLLWECVNRSDIQGIHHWTDAGRASWYELAVAIAEEAPCFELLPPGVEVRPISTLEFPLPAHRPRFSVLDTEATSAAVGMQPTPWRENLRAILKELVDG